MQLALVLSLIVTVLILLIWAVVKAEKEANKCPHRWGKWRRPEKLMKGIVFDSSNPSLDIRLNGICLYYRGVINCNQLGHEPEIKSEGDLFSLITPGKLMLNNELINVGLYDNCLAYIPQSIKKRYCILGCGEEQVMEITE